MCDSYCNWRRHKDASHVAPCSQKHMYLYMYIEKTHTHRDTHTDREREREREGMVARHSDLADAALIVEEGLLLLLHGEHYAILSPDTN